MKLRTKKSGLKKILVDELGEKSLSDLLTVKDTLLLIEYIRDFSYIEMMINGFIKYYFIKFNKGRTLEKFLKNRVDDKIELAKCINIDLKIFDDKETNFLNKFIKDVQCIRNKITHYYIVNPILYSEEIDLLIKNRSGYISDRSKFYSIIQPQITKISPVIAALNEITPYTLVNNTNGK